MPRVQTCEWKEKNWPRFIRHLDLLRMDLGAGVQPTLFNIAIEHGLVIEDLPIKDCDFP